MTMIDLLEQLADHLDDLDDQLETLTAAGEFLWFRPSDNTFHATALMAPKLPGDMYLFHASPTWLAQWDGDLRAAGEALVDALGETLAGMQSG